jgi:hypothetical protein
MGQTTHQIETHIENTREDLGCNLHELESKVRAVTDWKQQFNQRPLTMLGVAFGGGILLATMMGGRKNRGRERAYARRAMESESHMGTDFRKHEALGTWDNIKGALIGVAATRFKEFVGDVIPGFQEQLQRTEEKAKAIQPSGAIT